MEKKKVGRREEDGSSGFQDSTRRKITKNERREARIYGKERGDRKRTEERRGKGGNYFQS